MDPGDVDWWWMYGLDGIVGGLIGAVLTAWITVRAVRLTLEHERTLAADATQRAEMAVDREVVTELDAALYAVEYHASSDPMAWATQVVELDRALALGSARLRRSQPVLADDLRELRNHARTHVLLRDRDRITAEEGRRQIAAAMAEAAGEARVRTTAWFEDPDAYEQRVPRRWVFIEQHPPERSSSTDGAAG